MPMTFLVIDEFLSPDFLIGIDTKGVLDLNLNHEFLQNTKLFKQTSSLTTIQEHSFQGLNLVNKISKKQLS